MEFNRSRIRVLRGAGVSPAVLRGATRSRQDAGATNPEAFTLASQREYAVQTPAANFLIVLNPRRSYKCTARSLPDVTVSETDV